MEKYFNLNAEGCSIRCKLFHQGLDGVKTAILYGHGFSGHKDSRSAERFARRVLEKNKGAVVLCFDWPCHGEDARKTLRLEDCLQYMRLLLSWLRERFPQAELYGCATSFGGYLFLKYLSDCGSPFRKTALRCPAVDMYGVLDRTILGPEDRKRLDRGKPILAGFDRKVAIDGVFLDSLRAAALPERDFLPLAEDLLILHGTVDEVVPFAQVRDFAEKNLIEFEAVEGADHRFQDPGKLDRANARILAFFGLR